jgi:hypothetical protein
MLRCVSAPQRPRSLGTLRSFTVWAPSAIALASASRLAGRRGAVRADAWNRLPNSGMGLHELRVRGRVWNMSRPLHEAGLAITLDGTVLVSRAVLPRLEEPAGAPCNRRSPCSEAPSHRTRGSRSPRILSGVTARAGDPRWAISSTPVHRRRRRRARPEARREA